MKNLDVSPATRRLASQPLNTFALALSISSLSASLVAPASAQTAKGSAPAARTGASSALPRPMVRPSGSAVAGQTGRSEYIIGPDDVLQIRVRNHDALDRTLTVRPDGRISFPRAGEVLATGKTARALESHIQRLLERTLNNARVEVEVKDAKSRQARISGAIKAAGTYNLKPNWRVTDVIAVAGGLTAKPTRIIGYVVRNGQPIPFNIEEASAHPSSPSNVALRPDDLILLNERDIFKQITISGAVAAPGAFDLEEGLTVVRLVAQAGGATQRAALKKAYILRKGVPIPLDLYSVLVEGVPTPQVTSFQFQPGDVLMIPENQARFSVTGYVSKPGYYSLPERSSDATLLRALAEAGSATTEGDLKAATLTRTVEGSAAVLPVNLDAMLKGRLPDSVTLQPDDLIYIPKRDNKVSVIGQVAKPGDYDLQDNMNLLSLLSAAGSPLDGAGLSKAYVLRDSTQMPVNLYAALREGQTETVAGFELKPGDVLVVPDVSDQVTVTGQVKTPGSFSLDDKLTPVSLVAKAGDATDKAALSQAYITRNGQKIQLDLLGVMTEGLEDPAVMGFHFQPGDVLTIPENRKHFAVLGQVAKPGLYAFPERAGQASVLKALGTAGGPLQQGGQGGADLKNAAIIRAVNGQATRIPINLEGLFKQGGSAGDLAANVQLQPEDVLYIPPRKQGRNWTGVLQAIPLLGFLGI